MTEIGLKGASGLGNTIIAYPIVKHYSEKFDKVYYMTDYPELYETLPNVICSKHLKLNYILEEGSGRKIPINCRFTYGPRKHKAGTSQFRDSCISAGIGEELGFTIPWKIRNGELVDKIRSVTKERKICVVSAPYEPFGRVDEFGKELRIEPDSIQRIIDTFRSELLFVTVGNKFCLYRPVVEYDLVEQTTVSDLMDLVSMCDMTLSQIGNMLPMAEALGKKNFLIFAKTGLESKHPFLSSITPQKTVHYKDKNCSVVDTDTDICERFDAFRK